MAKKNIGTGAGLAQLKADLKAHSPGKCYVLYGEEDYLRRYYFEQLKKQLLDPATEAFNFHRLTSETFTLPSFTQSLEALPMMSERSLVSVEDVDIFSLREDERTEFAAQLCDLPDYACLVLSYTDFKPDRRQKKLWEALEKSAVLAEFVYQSEDDLRAWVARHFRAEGKYAAPELCAYLIQRCGTSMTRLDAEMRKVCAYAAGQELTRADLDAVTEPTLEASVFEMTDAIADRAFDRALERLNTILLLRAEPIPVLAAIGMQMRRLYAARVLLSEGKDADALASVCSMPPFAARMTMKQARRLSDRFCRRAVLLCCDTDYQMKTSYDEPEYLLQTLLFSLTEEARND